MVTSASAIAALIIKKEPLMKLVTPPLDISETEGFEKDV